MLTFFLLTFDSFEVKSRDNSTQQKKFLHKWTFKQLKNHLTRNDMYMTKIVVSKQLYILLSESVNKRGWLLRDKICIF